MKFGQLGAFIGGILFSTAGIGGLCLWFGCGGDPVWKNPDSSQDKAHVSADGERELWKGGANNGPTDTHHPNLNKKVGQQLLCATALPSPLNVPGIGQDDSVYAPDPKPGSEEYYSHNFVQLARSDPAAFERELAEILAESPVRLARAVGAFRAAWSVKSTDALPWFEKLLSLPACQDVRRDTLIAFGVNFLCRQSGGNQDVRLFLERQALERHYPTRTELRACMAQAACQYASESDLYRLTAFLSGETEPPIIAAMIRGLLKNNTQQAHDIVVSLSQSSPCAGAQDAAGELLSSTEE